MVAGARMALKLDDIQAPAGEWAVALFEISTGKATAAAGRVIQVGDDRYIEFERRDWERLASFTSPSDASIDPVPEPRVRQGARALVVEDERVSREMVASFLLGLGMVVRPTATAERASQWLDTEHFDLAVLDLALPGMGGLELCESIRRRGDAAQGLPILILTADGADETARRASKAGADDFITKPVPVLEFRARVLALLRRGRESMG